MKTQLSLDALIVLSSLKNERQATLDVLARRLQKEKSDASIAVEQLVERGIVERVGNGRTRRYILSSNVYALSGDEIGYTRQKGMTVIREMALIDRHLEQFGKITRSEVAELCKCELHHASYLLRKMIREGRAQAIKMGKFTYYTHSISEPE